MFRNSSKRLAEVAKTAQPSTVERLHELPTSTGAGLFVEHPTFEPLGTPPTLLHVSLPASSVFNARTRSLVAANGDLSAMSQKLSVLNLWEKPLLYNELTSTKPLSLLLSSAKGFVNLELAEGDRWTVMSTDAIAGWYGDLELGSVSGISKGAAVEANGKGNLLLTGQSQVFTIQLGPEETINVSPGSLIAYTGEKTGFNKLKSLELPTFGVWNTLKGYYNGLINTDKAAEAKEINKAELPDKTVVEEKETTTVDRVKEWISTKVSSVLLQNRLFYEVKGPATLIIQNDFKKPLRAFTQKELTQIYKEI